MCTSLDGICLQSAFPLGRLISCFAQELSVSFKCVPHAMALICHLFVTCFPLTISLFPGQAQIMSCIGTVQFLVSVYLMKWHQCAACLPPRISLFPGQAQIMFCIGIVSLFVRVGRLGGSAQLNKALFRSRRHSFWAQGVVSQRFCSIDLSPDFTTINAHATYFNPVAVFFIMQPWLGSVCFYTGFMIAQGSFVNRKLARLSRAFCSHGLQIAQSSLFISSNALFLIGRRPDLERMQRTWCPRSQSSVR